MTGDFGSTALTTGAMPTITEATVLRAAMRWTERDRATDSESPMPCSPTERLSSLKYIDFVKVQVGVNAKSGPLGEVSTEVFSFADLSIAE